MTSVVEIGQNLLTSELKLIKGQCCSYTDRGKSGVYEGKFVRHVEGMGRGDEATDLSVGKF